MRIEVPVRTEKEITEETLAIREGFRHAYIVINDMDGSMSISDEEYLTILNTVKSDVRYNFLYMGSNQIIHLGELGFADADSFEEKECSLGLFHKGKEFGTTLGLLAGTPEDAYWPDVLIGIEHALNMTYDL